MMIMMNFLPNMPQEKKCGWWRGGVGGGCCCLNLGINISCEFSGILFLEKHLFYCIKKVKDWSWKKRKHRHQHMSIVDIISESFSYSILCSSKYPCCCCFPLCCCLLLGSASSQFTSIHLKFTSISST